MSTNAEAVTPVGQANQQIRYHVRFTLWERWLHAVIFSTFIGLALTGLPLRFSHSSWAETYAHLVGGFASILFFHKFCAVILTLAFLTHLGDIFRRVVIKKEKGILWGPNSLVPRGKDFVDLYQHFKWFLWMGPRPKLTGTPIGRNSITGPFFGAWRSSGFPAMPCGLRLWRRESFLVRGSTSP